MGNDFLMILDDGR